LQSQNQLIRLFRKKPRLLQMKLEALLKIHSKNKKKS
jgi:hypothetical protein